MASDVVGAVLSFRRQRDISVETSAANSQIPAVYITLNPLSAGWLPA